MPHVIRRFAYGLGGLLSIALLLIGGVYLIGSSRASRTVAVSPALSTVTVDSLRLARGEHLANTLGCRDCHGEDLSGRVFADVPPLRATASNLTPGRGGVGQTYTVADWDRAIRHGVHPTGRGLQIMPSVGYHYLTDADAEALIAYLQSLPPVDRELPPTKIRPLGRVLMGMGEIDPHHEVNTATDDRLTTIEPAPTAAYGAYLAALTCRTCHGPTLEGGPHPDPGGPPAPDLRAASAWTFDMFAHTMRTGTRPNGSQMEAKWMPWTAFRHMTDTELRALHAHLNTLPMATASAE